MVERRIKVPKIDANGNLIRGSEFALNPTNQRVMVNNLHSRSQGFSQDTINRGLEWYASAHKDANFVGSGNAHVGADAISLLSGRTNYQINRQMAIQAMSLSDDHIASLRHAENLIRTANVASKVLGKNHPDVLRHKADAKQIRETILGGTPLVKMTTNSILRARSVIVGENAPGTLFTGIGKTGNRISGSKKQYDFSNQMRTAGEADDFAPIDTHAYDAALGRTDIQYGVGNAHLQTIGGAYDFIHNAYKKALSKSLAEGTVPQGTTIGQYQAIHWVHQQNLKANRADVRSNMLSQQSAALTYAQRNPQLDPSTHGLDPIESVPSMTKRLNVFAMGSGEGRR